MGTQVFSSIHKYRYIRHIIYNSKKIAILKGVRNKYGLFECYLLVVVSLFIPAYRGPVAYGREATIRTKDEQALSFESVIVTCDTQCETPAAL